MQPYAGLNFMSRLKACRLTCDADVLIIGGGIAGMTAALEIADAGYPVHLVEKEIIWEEIFYVSILLHHIYILQGTC